MVHAKITKLCLHLLKLCRKNVASFFPDTVIHYYIFVQCDCASVRHECVRNVFFL